MTIDSAWHRVRKTEGEVLDNHLTPYLLKLPHIEDILCEAQIDFFFDEDFDLDLDDELCEAFDKLMFLPWFLFNWKTEDETLGKDFHNQTIAQQYLEKFRYRLTLTQQSFIEAMLQSYYSFYVVLDVVPDRSITLKDILLQTEHVIKEYIATRYLKRGDLIYTRIITLDGISISVGTAPKIIPSHYHIRLLDYKKNLTAECGQALTGKLLLDYEPTLRATYFELIEPREVHPVLHNTDGDLVEPCSVHFTLHLKPEQALIQLLPLTLSKDPSEFLPEDHNDRIHFPWLKRGNKQHTSWDNTVMGEITIHKNKLTAQVNSRVRTKKIQDLISKYLGNEAVFVKTVVESIESTANKPSSKKKSAQQNEQDIDDFSQTPEAMALIKKFMKKHWDDWIDMKLPILDDLTPRQAAKTKDGREELEALLLDFERKNNIDPDNSSNPDVNDLRKKLGL